MSAQIQRGPVHRQRARVLERCQPAASNSGGRDSSSVRQSGHRRTGEYRPLVGNGPSGGGRAKEDSAVGTARPVPHHHLVAFRD